MKFLLDLNPYNQEKKVLTLVIDIPLNLAKLIYIEEEEDVPFYDVCPCPVPGWDLIHKLFNRSYNPIKDKSYFIFYYD